MLRRSRAGGGSIREVSLKLVEQLDQLFGGRDDLRREVFDLVRFDERQDLGRELDRVQSAHDVMAEPSDGILHASRLLDRVALPGEVGGAVELRWRWGRKRKRSESCTLVLPMTQRQEPRKREKPAAAHRLRARGTEWRRRAVLADLPLSHHQLILTRGILTG